MYTNKGLYIKQIKIIGRGNRIRDERKQTNIQSNQPAELQRAFCHSPRPAEGWGVLSGQTPTHSALAECLTLSSCFMFHKCLRRKVQLVTSSRTSPIPCYSASAGEFINGTVHEFAWPTGRRFTNPTYCYYFVLKRNPSRKTKRQIISLEDMVYLVLSKTCIKAEAGSGISPLSRSFLAWVLM